MEPPFHQMCSGESGIDEEAFAGDLTGAASQKQGKGQNRGLFQGINSWLLSFY